MVENGNNINTLCEIKLRFYDFSGFGILKSFIEKYSNNSIVALVVYDVTDVESFKMVDKWM